MTPVVALHNYLVVGAILFALGAIGFLARRNFIIMFLSAELMLQGVAITFVAFARYFEPAYPALVLLAAVVLVRAWALRRRPRLRVLGLAAPAVVLLTAAWALAFLHVYRAPLTRIEASRWIYAHLPPRSQIMQESWDDGLPLGLGDLREIDRGPRARRDAIELLAHVRANAEASWSTPTISRSSGSAGSSASRSRTSVRATTAWLRSFITSGAPSARRPR